ncbi:FMN-binding protein MioC [Haemophilus pittmaniae]|uniref:FMN-binding protein MioC n=1 Tax=Haemophilus pittmaniae TaxID=249188 RepID=A0A377IYU8_9PAST|nr:FMN-binding protein MioC [Haemophilus pittmaniae]STO92820.1 FMN-binding protein MioC [Haemophilus pittmaniae]
MQIAIISGSTLGGAEYVAERLADELGEQGFSCDLLAGPQLSEVNAAVWLIVTSTHGAGELPDNLKPFYQQVAASDTDFSQLRYAIVGLGNSDYDTFCYAVRHLENLLAEKGAQRLCDSLKIDVINVDDHEQYAADWLPNFTATLAD